MSAAPTSVGAMSEGRVHDVLHAAVASFGGQERPGQVAMADAVETALATGEHLLVQAGTGTGKSLAYLVPALMHPRPIVVATATLALQHQLVERDLPALVAGAREQLGTAAGSGLGDVPYAVLKGRSNYACLHRIREGTPDDTGVLVEVPDGTLGGEVVRLRSWAEEEAERNGRGDRDAAPTHTDRGWAQVAVSARECLGAQRCPYGGECFAERARDTAMDAQVVVTNHALLAIDAIDGVPMLPEHAAVVVDEGHELVARVTQASTDELSSTAVERASRRVRAAAGPEGAEQASDLADAGDALRDALEGLPGGRLDEVPDAVADALVLVRDSARACVSALGGRADAAAEGDGDAVRQQAKAAADEVRKVAERLAAGGEQDVRWVAERERHRGGNELRVAPLDVALSLRDKLFGRTTVVMTSATLKLGGGFEPLAASVGLRPDERLDDAPGRRRRSRPWSPLPTRPWLWTTPRTATNAPTPTSRTRWTGGRWTSAHRSTTSGRRSSTSPGTLRRRDATGSAPPPWTRSSPWSRPPAAVPSGSSRRGEGPRQRPSTSATRCPTSTCGARATPSCPSCSGGSSRTRAPACSARCRCGRASTCRARPASWWSSTGSRSRGPTTR